MAVAADTVERQLAWEARWRTRAAAAAGAAGLLLVAGTALLQFVVFVGYPSVGLVQALGPLLTGASSAAVDPRSAGIAFRDHHAAGLIATGAVTAIATALLAVVLVYLYRAVAFRRPQTPAAARVLALAGPLAAAVLSIAGQVVTAIAAHDFVAGSDHTHRAAENVFFRSGGLVAVGYLGLASQFALGFALIIISLNAMRVGLLNRFMGVLGIIVGVLFVIPLGTLPVVQALWFVALAALISGRWPNGTPPAWAAGRAIPWPSQQQLREQRQSASSASAPAADGPPVPAPPRAPASASAKRRRKKRR